jgi:hypothetical protein
VSGSGLRVAEVSVSSVSSVFSMFSVSSVSSVSSDSNWRDRVAEPSGSSSVRLAPDGGDGGSGRARVVELDGERGTASQR